LIFDKAARGADRAALPRRIVKEEHVKKLVIAATAIALVALVFTGCPSAPQGPASTPVPADTTPFKVIQHKGTTLGVNDVPKWVTASLEGNSKLEALYPGRYCVVVDFTAGDLEAAKVLASEMNARKEIANRISTRVQAKFAGAQVGDKTKVESYFENVVKVTTDANFTGFSQEADWWVQIRWYKTDGKVDREEFRYLILFTIDKALLDKQISDILNKANKVDPPKTEDEQKARDLVNKAITTDF
jgi:hypothetical protein